MSEINPTNGLTEAVLVHQFTSARTFVQSCVQQAESGSEASSLMCSLPMIPGLVASNNFVLYINLQLIMSIASYVIIII